MKEFRVVANPGTERYLDRRVRMFLWGSVLGLSGVTLFALYGHSLSRQLSALLIALALSALCGAIAAAYYLAIRHGQEKVERELVIVLADDVLVRRSRGYPEVRIGLTEITRLSERSGRLTVESVSPRRTITIPNRVEGFVALRTELANHCPIVAATSASMLGLVLVAIYIFCWAPLLWSRNVGLILSAGVIALFVQAWTSLRLSRYLRKSPQRFVTWGLLALSWVTAAVIIWSRVLRWR